MSTALALLEKFRKIKTLSITPKDHLASKNVHSLDELSIYKELLDAGALTQEEFDEKKKQILGL
ncbi:MAG: SHOCT domain-containing protein [Oscillospiraceae bacterium]|nr:SHOCT domain-containing protein [Oscillospiraceae bacterium]MCI9563149.1 SHOCT domain-containing protein [Oscillospiraceae bacterium]